MSYPSFPQAPGVGGLLIPFDPTFMMFGAGSPVATLYGTLTGSWPNTSVSGGAGIYQPFGELNVATAMLGSWTKPPAGQTQAVVFPLLLGRRRGFIALAPGGST